MSSPFRAFRNLTPQMRIAVGVSLLAWGTAGLYISDAAEKKLGFEPSEGDREALEKVMPRIRSVDRTEARQGTKGD